MFNQQKQPSLFQYFIMSIKKTLYLDSFSKMQLKRNVFFPLIAQ